MQTRYIKHHNKGGKTALISHLSHLAVEHHVITFHIVTSMLWASSKSKMCTIFCWNIYQIIEAFNSSDDRHNWTIMSQILQCALATANMLALTTVDAF